VSSALQIPGASAATQAWADIASVGCTRNARRSGATLPHLYLNEYRPSPLSENRACIYTYPFVIALLVFRRS
jgi:hypothetical protein